MNGNPRTRPIRKDRFCRRQFRHGTRESRFVVADLTLNRQSVYYEVGYAHSFGLQAVLTCRVVSFEDKTDPSRHVHFDLDHRPVLTWGNEAQLAEKLERHILMVFGRSA